MSPGPQGLSAAEYETLLEVNRQLDDFLDQGLVEKLPVELTVRRSMAAVLGLVRDRGGTDRLGPLLAAYRDHFENPVFVSDDPARVQEALDRLGGPIPALGPRHREEGPAIPADGAGYLQETLQVFDYPLGTVSLFGSDGRAFDRELLKIVAQKLDTHIYQLNALLFEELKTLGAEGIDHVFDGDDKLRQKYRAALQLVTESIGAAAGFLVLPQEGHLQLAATFVRTPLKASAQQILAAARQAWDGEPGAQTPSLVPGEELMTVILKPGSQPAEGVLVLGNPLFTRAQHTLVDFYSTLIDSTIHLNRLHARAFDSFIDAVAVLIDRFDGYTSGHSRRVTAYALALGEVLALSQTDLDKLRVAAMLHDIGKVGLEPELLSKRGPLDQGEKALLQAHPILTESMLTGISIADFDDLHVVAACHHEREDGSGYPRGLSGDEIPFLTKIIIIADVFDAVTSDRAHCSGRSLHEGHQILADEARSGRLCPVLVERFLQTDVWERIRRVFQSCKVRSHFERWERIPAHPELLGELRQKLERLNDSGMDLCTPEPGLLAEISALVLQAASSQDFGRLVRELLDSLPG